MIYKNQRPCRYQVNDPVSVVHPDKLEKVYDGIVTNVFEQPYGYKIQVSATDGSSISDVWPTEWIRRRGTDSEEIECESDPFAGISESHLSIED